MLPRLETERLLLRPRSITDLDDCLAMDSDPLVTQFIPGPWSDPAKHRAFVIGRMAAVYPEGLGYWSVADRQDPGGFLGWILLLPYEVLNEEVEIGWRFFRRHWGKGYATEAASPVLAHAFEQLRLDRVVADIDPANAASINVAEKLGLRFIEDRCFDGWRARSYQLGRPGSGQAQ